MDKKDIVFIYLDKLFNKSKKIGKFTHIDEMGNILLNSHTYEGFSGEPQTSLNFDKSQHKFISKMFNIGDYLASEYIFEYIKTILIPDMKNIKPEITLYIS